MAYIDDIHIFAHFMCGEPSNEIDFFLVSRDEIMSFHDKKKNNFYHTQFQARQMYALNAVIRDCTLRHINDDIA